MKQAASFGAPSFTGVHSRDPSRERERAVSATLPPKLDHSEARVGSVGRPLAYFITFACYGAVIEQSPARIQFERKLSRGAPVTLNADERDLVLGALRRHCEYREWFLWAAHARSNHVHVVLSADVAPAEAMSQLKRYASRALNGAGSRPSRRWARHGSTRYLWTEEHLALAVDYVAREQGLPMALYLEG